MATAVQKITLSSSRDIPFNKLVLSQSNVRRIKAGVSVEDLAESIARRGLIQSLHVRAVLDADGVETGMFEVPAGGRRYRALELLVKQKRLNKTAPVPCVVSDAASGILMEEISFAENDERIPPHPLDQYRAFQAMRDKGMSEEAIAAAFLIDVNVLKQRLRMPASISIAQWILESGSGRHMPPGSNNPFGIKAGRGQPSVMVRTREETKEGRSVYINAPFRKFSSLAEAFDQHGKLLATHPAYSLARQHTDDPDAYADALTHHYATDSHYGRLLKSIMKSRSLYQFN